MLLFALGKWVTVAQLSSSSKLHTAASRLTTNCSEHSFKTQAEMIFYTANLLFFSTLYSLTAPQISFTLALSHTVSNHLINP